MEKSMANAGNGLVLAAIALFLCACASVPSLTTEDIRQLIASPIRTEADRTADATRKPLEFLQFTQVRRGQQVLDVASGGGFTAQLLALAVGQNGKAWAQVTQLRPALEKRLADHPDSNVTLLVRPLDYPFPADAPRVDLVTLVLSYHDIANTPVDRAKMNRGIFNALKPGGRLIVIDHSTKPGAGITQTKTLHRIDEAAVIEEVTRAGFVLEATGDYLRNPSDPREQTYVDLKTMPSDKFALRFVRP